MRARSQGHSHSKSVALGEVIEFRNDIVHPSDNPSGTVTFVGLEHIERDTGVRLGSEQIKLEEMTGRRARFFAGDIVYGYLRPYLNKVWTADFDGICSVDQYVFKTRSNADRNYVAHYLRSQAFLRAAPVDTTPGQLPRIRSGEIASTTIPLPPLDEQKRIAAILDQADALRRLRQRAIDRLNALGQAIFYEMFREEIEADQEEMISLSEILEFSNGVNFSADQKGGEGCLVLDVLNMYSDTIYPDLASLYRVRDLRNIETRILQEGDILFVRSSLKEEGVGWPVLFSGYNEPVSFCGFIIRGRPKENSLILQPHFLIHYLRQPQVRKQMIANAGKVAITNINQSRLGDIRVPRPTKGKQMKFAEQTKIIEVLVREARREVKRLSDLFLSLQHRAFTGQL